MKNNQDGFSLIQVLIAFGLTTVLALQLFRMNSFQLKTSKNTEVALDINLMMNQISLYLGNSISCQNTFSNIAIDTAYEFDQEQGIKNRDNHVVYGVGRKYAGNKILVKSIIVEQSSQDPLNPPSDIFGVVNVKVTLEKLPGFKNTLSTKEITKTIPVQIQVNPNTSLVRNCYSVSDQSLLSMRAQTCEQDLGGQWNHNLGKCEDATLGQESAGSMCGTCQVTTTETNPTSHRDLHRTAMPGRMSSLLGRWFHGWRNTSQSDRSNRRGEELGVSCTTHLACKGADICGPDENGVGCIETCPQGYSLQTIYQDFDISDKTYNESILSKIDLKTCVKDS